MSLRGMVDVGPSLSLQQLLNEIWATALPLSERRRLARQVVTTAALGNGANSEQAEAKAIYEELLDTVGKKAGLEHKPSIVEAKHWLRSRGSNGCRMASRLGKISKLRNLVAHPDPTLLKDILDLGEQEHDDSDQFNAESS